MANRKTAAAKSAERLVGYVKPAAFDAEEQRLQAEFAGLDLTEEEQADFAEALRLRLGSNADQMAARAVINRLRIAQREAVNETLGHHRRSGATVERMPKSDAFRIIDRDGLVQLRQRQKRPLTVREVDGGLAYRKRYEAAAKGLRSAFPTLAAGGSSDPKAIAAAKALAAKWAEQLAKVDQAVVQDCGEPGLALLRKVAGEARSITGLLHPDRRSGRDVDAAVELLARALRICADRLPLA